MRYLQLPGVATIRPVLPIAGPLQRTQKTTLRVYADRLLLQKREKQHQ